MVSVLLICGAGAVFSQVKKGIPGDTLPEWQKCLKTVFPVRKPAIPVLREADSGNSFSSLFRLEFGAKNC